MSAKPRSSRRQTGRKTATDDDIKSIFLRLYSTHTKASSGAGCKTSDVPPPPGLGKKMYPEIPGLDDRFSGRTSQASGADTSRRLHETTTTSSTARGAPIRILLYPERTLLMNDAARITAYQQDGVLGKQSAYPRREKWYN